MSSIPVIVDMHAEDAAILWVQRNRAVDAPHFNVKFLARLDERLEANLDGLRVAGRKGWEVARAAFDRHTEPGEMFTLSALAFGAASKRGIGEVLEIVSASDDPELLSAAVSGLGWLDRAALRGLVQPLLDDKRAGVRALGLGACCVHRVHPGDQLGHFLKDAPTVRAAALKLAGQVGASEFGPFLTREDAGPCQYRAAWADTRFGDRKAALSALWEVAVQPGRHQTGAFELATSVSGPDEIGARLRDAGSGAPLLAIRAAGRVGRGDTVAWLIDQMRQPDLAAVAGESFAMITGADLAFLDLDQDATEEGGPNDDPADPVVLADDDAELPVPDVAKVAAWWEEKQGRFAAGQRYFLGQPIGPEAYAYGLAQGFQRQRRVAAHGMACLDVKAALPSWRARQRRVPGPHHAQGYWQVVEAERG